MAIGTEGSNQKERNRTVCRVRRQLDMDEGDDRIVEEQCNGNSRIEDENGVKQWNTRESGAGSISCMDGSADDAESGVVQEAQKSQNTQRAVSSVEGDASISKDSNRTRSLRNPNCNGHLRCDDNAPLSSQQREQINGDEGNMEARRGTVVEVGNGNSIVEGRATSSEHRDGEVSTERSGENRNGESEGNQS